LQPFQDDRGVQSTGVGQHDFANTRFRHVTGSFRR
jgi:hypothetical protein